MLDLNIQNPVVNNSNHQPTSEEYLRANSSHLLQFFRRHSHETETNPLLAGLKDRVEALNESASSSESFVASNSITPPPFQSWNLFEKVRNTFPCKRQKISDSILLGKFEKVSDYFYKHPKMTFIYSQMLLTHVELGTLPKDELLKILYGVAAALNEKDHKRKLPSILETFESVISIERQKDYSVEEIKDLLILFKQDQFAKFYSREFAKTMGSCLFLNILGKIAKLEGDVSESIEHQLLIELQCHCSYMDEKKIEDSLPLLQQILEKPGGVLVVSDVMKMKDSSSARGVFNYKSLTKEYFELFVQMSKKEGGIKIISEWLTTEEKGVISSFYCGPFLEELEGHFDWLGGLLVSKDGQDLCYILLQNLLPLKNINEFLCKLTTAIANAPGGFEVLKRYLTKYEVIRAFQRTNPALFEHVISLQDVNSRKLNEYIKIWINSEWLEKEKVQKNFYLDKNQYKEKLSQTKDDINSLIVGMDFGDSKDPVMQAISTICYTQNSKEVTETLSKKDVSNALKQLFNKLGRPGEWDDLSNESHENFGVFLLGRLMPVVFTLKQRNDPKLTAGVVIALAKIEVSGKCSSAYPPEFEQLNQLYGRSSDDKEGLSFKDMIEEEVQMYFSTLVEKILKQKYNAVNVHYRNYYLRCMGLYPFEEPAVKKLVKCSTVLEEIKSNFDHRVLTKQIETHLLDQIRLYLKEMTPSDFNPDLLKKIDEAKESERNLEKSLVDRFRVILPNEALVDQLVKEFHCWRSPCIDPRLQRIPFSKLNEQIRSNAKTAFLKLVPNEAFWEELNLKLSLPKTDDNETNLQTLIKNMDPVLSTDASDVMLKKIDVMRKINSIVQVVKSQEDTVERFEKMIALKKEYKPFADQIWVELVGFTNQIKQIAEELEAYYDFKEFLLPSIALEFQRREDYLDQNPDLGQKLIIEQLVEMQILETINP